jgi:AcrR family transcriptional regulator
MQERTPMTRVSTFGEGNTQDRILATATGLFARYGFNGVSTRHIASGADVNEVTIYRRYPSKRALYHAVLESELQQVSLRGDLLAHVADARSGRAALDRTFELIAATFSQKPEFFRLVQFSVLELNEDLDQLLRKHLGELIEVLAGYLKPWIEAGELRCSNPKALVLTLVTIAFSYHALHRMFSADIATPETMLRAYEDLYGCADR